MACSFSSAMGKISLALVTASSASSLIARSSLRDSFVIWSAAATPPVMHTHTISAGFQGRYYMVSSTTYHGQDSMFGVAAFCMAGFGIKFERRNGCHVGFPVGNAALQTHCPRGDSLSPHNLRSGLKLVGDSLSSAQSFPGVSCPLLMISQGSGCWRALGWVPPRASTAAPAAKPAASLTEPGSSPSPWTTLTAAFAASSGDATTAATRPATAAACVITVPPAAFTDSRHASTASGI